nr:MAG TPA: hypothetical protein [Inoviridae sp.]
MFLHISPGLGPTLYFDRSHLSKYILQSAFTGKMKNFLAFSGALCYYISAFRTGADFRSVPQGWPGGGSSWRQQTKIKGEMNKHG